MTTRRNFLKASGAAATTGVAFCSCGLLERVGPDIAKRFLPPVSTRSITFSPAKR